MKTPIYRAVGQRIKEIRKARGITQLTLGDAIGLSRTSVANIEAGNQQSSLTILEGVAAALCVDLIDLFTTADKAKDNGVYILKEDLADLAYILSKHLDCERMRPKVSLDALLRKYGK